MWEECPPKMQPNWPPAGCMASAARGSHSILSDGCGGARPVLRAPCFQPFSVLNSSMETQPQNKRKSKWDGCKVKGRGILNTAHGQWATVGFSRIFSNILLAPDNVKIQDSRFYSEVLVQTWLSLSQLKVLSCAELDCSCTWLLVNVSESDLELHTNQQRDTKVPLLVSWNWRLVSTVA